MVARGADLRIDHARVRDLWRWLDPGDLLVVNTSATLPAAVAGRHQPADGRPDEPTIAHLASPLPGGLWLAELRRPVAGGNEPWRTAAVGDTVLLEGGGRLHLVAPWRPGPANGARLWVVTPELGGAVEPYLMAHGSPIQYRTTARPVGIDAYQSAFATTPGSAEMPSAARPLSSRVITDLVAHGVLISPLLLHTGVSSLEEGEESPVERFEVPATTAALVDQVHQQHARVVAVGTTVVRALETTADERGRSHPGRGWTDLVLSPERPVRVVDGLLTGWHEPRSSHLRLLESVAGRPLLERSYTEAVAERYRWHEFGDLHLLLP